jgi:hypothetical protein
VTTLLVGGNAAGPAARQGLVAPTMKRLPFKVLPYKGGAWHMLVFKKGGFKEFIRQKLLIGPDGTLAR